MARLFDDGSSEYLLNGSPIVSAPPFTISARVAKDDVDASCIACSLAQSTTYGYYLRLNSNGTARWYANPVSINTTTSGDDTAWHHLCAVEASTTSHAVYFDGGGKATSSSSASFSPVNTSIGASYHPGIPSINYPMSGRIGEVAIWNAALTDGEVALLALKVSPLFVRPQNLVAYWPLIRDEDQDRVGGYDMTAYNIPSIGAHPPVLYPAPPYIAYAAAGAPPPAGQPMHLRALHIPYMRQWQPGRR